MPQTPQPETYTLPAAAPFTNHGRTPAAWVLMLGVCAGFLVSGLGLAIGNDLVAWIGAGVVVLSVIVSVILRGMGLGQPAPEQIRGPERDWYGD